MRRDDSVNERIVGTNLGSPHVRGDDDPRVARIIDIDRFTPTCVGTTRFRAKLSPETPVHPHVRGDDARLVAEAISESGSPPRAWGRRGAT
jgi:hypothetical protein